MPHTPTPWLGIAAVVAMFVLPFLPDWLFEGRRTVKHWPRRHVCGYCNAPWTEGHTCAPAPSDPDVLLHGQLTRVDPGTELEPVVDAEIERRPRVRLLR